MSDQEVRELERRVANGDLDALPALVRKLMAGAEHEHKRASWTCVPIGQGPIGQSPERWRFLHCRTCLSCGQVEFLACLHPESCSVPRTGGWGSVNHTQGMLNPLAPPGLALTNPQPEGGGGDVIFTAGMASPEGDHRNGRLRWQLATGEDVLVFGPGEEVHLFGQEVPLPALRQLLEQWQEAGS